MFKSLYRMAGKGVEVSVPETQDLMDSHLATFREQGFLVVRPQDASFLSLVAEARAKAMAFAEQPPAGLMKKWTHTSGKVKHLVNAHRLETCFSRVMEAPVIQEVVKDLAGEGLNYITHSKLSYKNMGVRQTWLPHQDSAYKLRPAKGVAVAVFLEDCAESNGALEIYPGSHRFGRLKHRIVFDQGENEPQVVVDPPEGLEAEALEGAAGTVVFFNLDTIHRSGRNSSGGCRPLLIFEVEPVTGFPMEADGQLAILLGGSYDDIPKPMFLFLTRARIRLFEFWVKPLIKAVLNQIFRFRSALGARGGQT